MKEQWKVVPGFERYQVSTLGRIKIFRDNQWEIQEAYKNRDGYLQMTFYNPETKKYRCYGVHRIVGLLFIPNPNGYKEINHIDGIKKHNTVENLEWCTRLHNMRHAHSMGLMKRKKQIGVRLYLIDLLIAKRCLTHNCSKRDIHKELCTLLDCNAVHLRKIRMSTVDKYINIHPTALVKLSKYFSVTIEDFINPPAMKEILKQSA